MPTRPRCIDFSDFFDGAVVVIAFRCEMFPHEKIRRLVVDGVSEVGECLEGSDGERWVGLSRLEPIVCVGKDKTHYVGPAWQ